MTDIIVSEAVKAFAAENNILNGVSFEVESGRHLGVLGRNGAGKTTLFKIITGELECDSGYASVRSGCSVGLISQIPVFPENFTVENVLRSAFDRINAAAAELRELESQMQCEHGKDVLSRYARVQQLFETLGGYDTEVEFAKVCNGLDIPADMRGRAFKSVSGGEQTRANLARLLLQRTDILLMDEPTNHLDMKSVEWLEDYLDGFCGTVLVISHDRYFLDRIAEGIIELEDGKVEVFKGNYTRYSQEKDRRYREELKAYEKDSKKLEQLKKAADKLHLWAFMGNDKLHKRAFSMEKRMEKLKTSQKPKQEKELKAQFGQTENNADVAIAANGLKKAFGSKIIVNDADVLVVPGERIALVGDNGAGKSTLLRIIAGEILPDAGYIRLGPSVRMAYLPQKVSFDAPKETVIDTVMMELRCSAQEARDRLGAFEFRGEDVFKLVGQLSGGEQSRLRLCLLMSEKINLLILDEPTNHLDIASRKWMENAVANFDGTLILVSHDRYFVSLFAERIWELDNGAFSDFIGTLEEFRVFKKEQTQSAAQVREKKVKPAVYRSVRDPIKALTKKIEDMEKKIAKAESDAAKIEADIFENAADYIKLTALFSLREQKNEELKNLYSDWEQLLSESEKIV